MSRIGLKPIVIPEGVDVKIVDGVVTVKGKNGELSQTINSVITVKREKLEEGDCILFSRPNDHKDNRSLHGLSRSLVQNMIIGVTEGYKKELEINGVGYRAAKQGKDLVLTLGYSHPVVMPEPEGINIEVPAQNKIIITGADKQLVGQVAAEIRGKRPPEPYKGKGIKYADETIRRKEGKAGAAATSA